MLGLSSALNAQSVPGSGPPAVVTTGRGEVRMHPDRALLMLAVETRARSAAQAASDNAKRQRAVIDSLKKLGVGDRAISTSSYSLEAEWRSTQPNTSPV